MNAPQKLVVIKLGGSVIDSKDATVLDVLELTHTGWRVVVVHGGGKLVTQWMAAQGVKSEFHQGERITDRNSLDVVTAVLCGLANKETTAAFRAAGINAVGLSGVDGGLVQGKVRDEHLGYIGDVVQVNPSVMETLLHAGFVPIVSPVSSNSECNTAAAPLLLNINGDAIAGEIAAAMQADLLVFLTDVDGIKDTENNTIRYLDIKQVKDLLDSGVAYGGMIPKLHACLRATNEKVVCRIVDGRCVRAVIAAVENDIQGSTISDSGRYIK